MSEGTGNTEELDHVDSSSPQITAVFHNDLISLKSRITSGKSPNVQTNQGNTLLHLAVMGNRREIFNFLLTVDSLRVDVLNFEGWSPLAIAVRDNAVYFVSALIEKGADVNLGALGVRPLFIATDVTIAKILLDKGADPDVLGHSGKTALHEACKRRDVEFASLLLYYGADVTVSSTLHVLPFAIAVREKGPLWFQEVLFDYTVTEEVEIHLANILLVMRSESPLIYKLLDKTSSIIYEQEDLDEFIEYVGVLPYDAFKRLIEKFPRLADDIFATKKCLLNYMKHVDENNFNWDIFEMCRLNSDCSCIQDEHQQLFLRNFPKEMLSEIVAHLLSYGLVISFKMFTSIYERQRFSPLVELMVHTEIRRHEGFEGLDSLFPGIHHLICCPDFDLEKRLNDKTSFIMYEPSCVELLNYFALPKLKRRFLDWYPATKSIRESIKQLPDVPSLLELSRNVARKFLIKRFRTENNVQFFALLNVLRVASVHKDVLAYKKPLYSVV